MAYNAIIQIETSSKSNIVHTRFFMGDILDFESCSVLVDNSDQTGLQTPQFTKYTVGASSETSWSLIKDN